MNLRALIKQSAGLDLAEAALERALRDLRQRGANDAGAAGAGAAPAPGTAQFDALLDLVVVPESWMLRDPAVFAAALDFVQRRLAQRPGVALRILSLPCAGGEEPYSMALTLADAGIGPERCRIDGFDLSRGAIERAHLGRYTRNAFRSADLAFRERWFTVEGDEYLIDPQLRAYVNFQQANLFALGAQGAHGGYDLVLCRNLLIYFDDADQGRAAQAIAAVLADDGLLLSGYAETPAFCRHGYTPAPQGPVFALHKAAAPVGGHAPTPARAPAPARLRVPARVRPAAPRVAPEPSRQPAAAAAPVAPELLARAQRLADAGQLAEAQADCRAVLALHPAHADAWFLLGLTSDCAGDVRAAERYWRRCLYLQPDHYAALCSLALLHEQRGDGARGASLRQRAARVFAAGGKGGGGQP
ncbi:protein-glutamate O-methyltransferase CheR [Massilia sp. 9096]|uniref:CheR family methyltransferase n=1 Tax=Massilia sp. 9096 TaxID=1500894 RepID=UPI000690C00E|nr:CheR family methyltransferase [Massilia sp. 9096]